MKNRSAAPRSRWRTTIAEGDRPHRGHRGEERHRREADRADPGRLLDEERPVLGQVPGEEDDEDHLEQLGRLAGDRADRQAQALAVDVVPEDERREQQGDAGGRPRVLVEPQPEIAPDRDREGGGQAERQHQPGELDVAEPELPRTDGLDDLVLGQPLHQEQADPAEHRRRREEDLVHPPPGQHQRQVAQAEQPEVDQRGGPGSRGSGRGTRRGRRPGRSGPARRCRPRSPRRRSGAGAPRASAAAAGSGRGSPAGSAPRRSSLRPRVARPLEAEPDLAELDDVAVGERT